MSSTKTLSFNKTIAAEHGVNAAVIYHNFCYWCDLNRANNRNHHEGNWWTYNSLEALQEVFEYMTVSAIRTALKKLVDSGLIKKGCFNANPYDKTAWYAICDFQHIDDEEIAHRDVADSKCTSAKNSTSSLPNITTDIKTNKKDSREEISNSKRKGMEYFAGVWKECKTKMGVKDSSSFADIETKWLDYFNAKYFKVNTLDDYDREVNQICNFAIEAHDVNASFCRYTNMQVGKFFTQKGWKDE